MVQVQKMQNLKDKSPTPTYLGGGQIHQREPSSDSLCQLTGFESHPPDIQATQSFGSMMRGLQVLQYGAAPHQVC